MIRIKMLGFIKKIFLTRLTILSYLNPLSTNQLGCISKNNQECKVRPEIISVNSDETVFLVLNTVVAATISMIHMQKYVFLMLQKI